MCAVLLVAAVGLPSPAGLAGRVIHGAGSSAGGRRVGTEESAGEVTVDAVRGWQGGAGIPRRCF